MRLHAGARRLARSHYFPNRGLRDRTTFKPRAVVRGLFFLIGFNRR